MRYRSWLIDFDGTLADSMPLLYRVYCHFLKHYGCTGSREEFLSLSGPTIGQVVDRLRIRHRLPGEVDILLREYQQLLQQGYPAELQLFAGAKSCLERAKEQGLQLAIVTSAARHPVADFLAHHGIDCFFDHIFSGEEVTTGKPDPALYRLALATLQRSPEEAVAIEDAPHGIAAACAAGIPVVWMQREDCVDIDFPTIARVKHWEDVERLLLPSVQQESADGR